MTIDAFYLNGLDRTKVREALNALEDYIGAPSIPSTERSKCRSFWNGLGLPSSYLDNMKMPDHVAAFIDPLTLKGVANDALERIIVDGIEILEANAFHVTADRWAEKLEELRNRSGEPVSEPVSKSVSQAQKQSPLVRRTGPSAEEKLAAILDALKEEPQIDEEAIRAVIDARLEERLKDLSQPRSIQVTINEKALTATKPQHRHFLFDMILQAVAMKRPVLLVGPAGSGKTTVARQIAEALEIDFYAVSGVESAYQLKGFIDAHGRPVQTDFQRAFTGGGLFLFDELDSSDPSAVKTLNSAIDNRFCDFADGIARAHEDFAIIAGANTYGRGADRQYAGSNQLDASTLNRFAVIDWDYDEVLERALAGNDAWCGKVQKWRKAKDALKIRHVISPRASIYGAEMLAAGWTEEQVENAYVWQGLDPDQVNKIKAGARS